MAGIYVPESMGHTSILVTTLSVPQRVLHTDPVHSRGLHTVFSNTNICAVEISFSETQKHFPSLYVILGCTWGSILMIAQMVCSIEALVMPHIAKKGNSNPYLMGEWHLLSFLYIFRVTVVADMLIIFSC